MGFLRKIASLVVLVAAVVALVGLCIRYDWNNFVEVFKHFDFNNLVDELLAFFQRTSSALILTMLGLIGLTMPRRVK